MAEKPEDQFNSEERIGKAKDLYAIGCRNYYVKSYSEAADDLSEACKLFGEEYGIDGEELGEVYLMYAKALIAIGQEENKLIDVPEEDEDEEDNEEGESPEQPEEVVEQTNGTDTKDNGEGSNGHTDEAGPSRVQENGSSNGDEAEEEGDEAADDGGNLELAWEVLLNAEAVFERQGSKGLNSLMDVYTEMAGISLENGNFEVSIKDFSRALAVFNDLEEIEQNPRIAAELHYKIGLCQSMLKLYDESTNSFKQSVDLLGEVIEAEKSKEEKTPEVLNTIEDLEETQKEIQNKIIEIGETKAEETELVKKELAKLLGPSAGGSSSDGAGPSNGAGSSSNGSASSLKPTEAEKPRATDISHLIKRKKPDTPSVDESPAKKMTLEKSPEA